MMKYMLSCIGAGILLTACQKTLSTGDAGFDVTVNTTTLPVGDTLRFAFTGNPDVISFYSGEPGKRYEYRDRTSANGTPTLRFRTTRANGSQANSLALLVSNDFAGVLVKDTAATISQINSATWTDISSRASFSSGTVTPSGTIDLSDFSAQNKPVFIAFKYNGYVGTAQSKWTIDSFTVTNTLTDGTKYVIANMNAYNSAYTNYGVTTYSPGFFACKVSNNYNWSIGSTSLVITGATSAGAATSPAEAWVITGPIDLKKVTPDAGVSIKTVSQTAGDLLYTYKYASPGTYQAVFSGGKASAGERHYTTKSFSITVQ